MQKIKRTKLLLAILLGLVLGSVCGIVFAIFIPSHSPLYASTLEIAKPFGLVFINLLKMIVVLVIIFTLISGVANISPFVWLNGLSPWLFLRRAFEPFLVAFITRSSGATLPISMNIAERKMGINKGIYSFTLPLGATINMDAIYLRVCCPLTKGREVDIWL
ncbi:cation:dicarboxylate symporter family transporter [Campylobacter iguaniorum]|uniref:cation:dicarboxylate symporter family transporter n=1 Tax=Campylobacter iguaniorum TaxID=1244531 RepID=UPI0007C9712F|nr:cation:dicarboxylase symporter family transporter [Campylobacter iguaniorum]